MSEFFRIELIVPSDVEGIKRVDLQKKWVTRTEKSFSFLYGGATSIQGSGAWLSSEVGLIREDVVLVFSIAEIGALSGDDKPITFDDIVRDTSNLALQIREGMQQYCVAFAIMPVSGFYLIGN